MSGMKVVQAVLLTLSLVFIVCFVYMFIANAGLMMNQRNRHAPPTASGSSSSSSSSSVKDEPTDQTNTSNGEVSVRTPFGLYKGFVEDVFGKRVNTFLGIPYAAPPIGKLRFRRTAPLLPSKFTVETKSFKNKCLQIKKEVPIFTDVSSGASEDCLYLNIWSPVMTQDVKDEKQPLKPVMIWIYGGGFFMGTSMFDETDGRVLASVGDVVVVSFDYRLGGLGFIDLGTDKESGNQGLYDQLTVLKWVRDNIKHFGGDASSVTLFGESSGAIAIGLHMMSPESSGLFKRVILESGSPFMTNAFFQRAEKSVPDFVETLGCLSDPEDKYSYDINCLRSKTQDELVEATQAMHEKYFFAFPPTPEEDFVPMLPTEVTKLEKAEKEDIFKDTKEIMIGNNIKAFSFMLYLGNKKVFSRDQVNKQFTSFDAVKDIMSKDIGHLLNMPNFQVNFIVNRLFSSIQNSTDPRVWLDRLIEILGDVSFVCPSNILIDELSSLGKPVYVYQLTQEPTGSPWAEWFGSTLHDEIPFVFGHPLRYPLRYSGKDIDLSKRIMQTWSHFAKTGEALSQLGSEWPPSTSHDRVFMQLDSEFANLGRNMSQETCETFRLGFELLN